ncbi:complex I NDUFA9 subunit family protein [Brevibacillus invocatus]|uniref:complex I NDUFA9 subunit family protein n=1 Tax=Brevibacillus invocatus TaxID=173959 RepID=UPI00203F9F55|nr:complex I NDUFA9 subunit family protein [Brevibacillus invocatus]MCM3082137.1 complex I NDUFA9 subunit family protein [Brevibacillus invocatus]MCM3432560.1 complex I NDUFA9 subunit family protein [Brevibacillus invocatus]
MKVFLTGSTGFVGKGMMARLQKEGHEIVCLIRPGSQGKIGQNDGSAANISWATGDLMDTQSLASAMRDCDAVIHLVGIIREKPGKGITFSRIHVEGTKNMLAAAKQVGIKRFVHMSALGARENATSAYHRSKYEAEQLVQNSGIPYVIFRPSVIFGPGDEFVNLLADLVRLPVTPVIGDGSYPLQPVARETVADVFVQALSLEASTQQIYETGGPSSITYGQILDDIGAAIGKHRVRKFHIPLGLMKPVINTMEGFSFFPITNTQLTMLLEGNDCKDAQRLYDTFSTAKIPFREGISTYLS